MARGIFSLFLINKSGGLIFHRHFMPVPKLDGNEYLRIASTFHSLYAISGQLSPISTPNSSNGQIGITVLDADSFKIHCHHTLTGLKFFVVCEPGARDVEAVLHHVYELYSDYVLKNPFYELEMPVRCDLFEKELDKLLG